MNHLPTELTDFIVDFHHSDKQTLRVCSLVCRNWLPASRFHLFGTIRVMPFTVQSFVELLAARSSTIASHVRILHILMGHNAANTVIDLIASFFDKFVAITSISLQCDQWTPVTEDIRFGRVGNMDLTTVFYDFVNQQFSLTFTLGDGGPSTFVSRLRVLRSIFSGKRKPLWLPLLVQLPAVREVELSRFREKQLPIVQAMLKSCTGESIHTIKLSLAFDPSQIAPICDYLDLSHVGNLRSLAIEKYLLLKTNRTAADEFLSKTIQKISSPCITHIRLHVLTDAFLTDLTWMDWKQVADELDHPRFSELQDVCVRISSVGDKEDEVRDLIHRDMSCLGDRSILTIIL